DRELIDVADDFLEYVRALFNRDKRRELRERNRARAIARRSSGARQIPVGMGGAGSAFPASAESLYDAAGTHSDRIRQANIDRDEINRLVATLPDRDRERVAE